MKFKKKFKMKFKMKFKKKLKMKQKLLVESSAAILSRISRVRGRDVEHDISEIRNRFESRRVRNRLSVELPLDEQIRIVDWDEADLKVDRLAVAEVENVLKIKKIILLNNFF